MSLLELSKGHRVKVLEERRGCYVKTGDFFYKMTNAKMV